MAKKKKDKKGALKEHNLIAYSLMSPWLLGSLLFVVYPIFSIIYMTFNNVYKDINGWNYDWIWFDNYTFAYTNPLFYQATLGFVLQVLTFLPVILIASLMIARLLITDIKSKAFFRVVFFLPVLLLSNSVLNMFSDAGSVGSLILNSDENFIISMIDSYSPFLAEQLIAIFGNLIQILWFTGIPIILFINALNKIDGSTYEAAHVDGATAWQILWKITLPSMKSTSIVIAVFSLVQLGSFHSNPLYELLASPLTGGSSNIGLAATYAFSYSVIIFIFIGLIAYVLRERKPKLSLVFRQSMAKLEQEEEAKKNEE